MKQNLKILAKLFVIALICLSLYHVIYHIYHTFHSKNVETYVSPDEKQIQYVSPSVSSFLRESGFDDIENLRKFIKGDYNEDVTEIHEGNRLTLYYSIFSKDSKDMTNEDDKHWRNISNYFKDSPPSWQSLDYNHSHLLFKQPPIQTHDNALQLHSNSIIGPPAHLLGINGNGVFSIFILLQFNTFTHFDEPQVLFKLSGNTTQNNGLSLKIDAKKHQKDARVIHVRFMITFGSDPILYSKNDATKTVSIDLSKPYLLVLTKNHKDINLNLHDMSIDSTHNSTTTLIDNAELTDKEVMFSNKELVINESTAFNGAIFAFGIYKVNLLDESFLHHFLFHQLQKRKRHFIQNAKQIIDFQDEIDQMKACKYDANVCKECLDITDWTDINQLILSNQKCKKAIHDFCEVHPNDSKCVCWREDQQNNPACRAFVSIFSGKPAINVENIDNDILEEIKVKYQLGYQKEIDELRDQLQKEKRQNLVMKENPTYKLNTPLLSQGPIEYINQEQDDFEQSSFLKHLPKDILPPVNNSTLDRIASENKRFQGLEEDAQYFNKSLNQIYGDPTINSNNEVLSETKPIKSFWAWLFRQ